MNDSKISVRYARALFESALDNEVLENIRDDMAVIREISLVPEFQKLLVNPVIKETKKNEIMENLMKKRIHPLSLNFLTLLIKNGREQYIPAITRNVIDLYRAHKGIKSATFITAVPVSNAIKMRVEKEIKDVLKFKVEMNTESSEDIIGGFIIRIENRQYDASVANGLKRIKKNLLN